MSFAPGTHEQGERWDALEPRFGHVSVELVCAGSGLPKLDDSLRQTGCYDEPDWLLDARALASEPTPVRIKAALAREARIGVAP